MDKATIKTEAIIKKFEDIYGIPKKDLLGKARNPEMVKNRFILYGILNRIGLSYNQIGRVLRKDHTTIIHGVKVAKDKYVLEIAQFDATGLEEIELIPFHPYTNGSSKKWGWVYKIFGGKCAVCGFSDVIQVHHLVPRSVGGTDDISNLIVLCPNHHALHHLGLVDISKMSPKKTELSTPIISDKLI